MPTRRRIAIAVQRDRVVHLRQTRAPVLAWCPGCAADAPMAAPEVAALLAGIATREIYRAVERKAVHYVEVAGGEVRVCLPSLGLDEPP